MSALDCWTDDTFYQSTVPALQWLATISHTQGLIESAQEELDPFPSWFIFAFNRRPYMLSKGSIVPFNEDDPPPSADAQDRMFSILRSLTGGPIAAGPPA